jgi:hypothetical protein
MTPNDVLLIVQICINGLLDGATLTTPWLELIFKTIAPHVGRLDGYSRDVAKWPGQNYFDAALAAGFGALLKDAPLTETIVATNDA